MTVTDEDSDVTWRVLVPFHVREAMDVEGAAVMAGRCDRTIRIWCAKHGIGRRIAGGNWMVSRVALAMLLDDDQRALGAYLDGARGSFEPVAAYYRRLGLGALLDRPDFAV
jgi:hypothetical protein